MRGGAGKWHHVGLMRLLVIEDEVKLAQYLHKGLSENGHVVDLAHDGIEGRRLALGGDYDLVLLDLMLPGADGWEVCRHLRARHANVPVIMLTARSAEAHRVLGLELGADDYVAKPFSMLELVARIRALFRRIEQLSVAPPTANELRFGPFLLDTVRRELLRGGQVVPLTLREFDLLHFLLKHPGRPFSRAELLQRVWGDGFDGYEHTVNSHINRLRNRIEDDPREPRRVVTVWGVGYRFDLEPAT